MKGGGSLTVETREDEAPATAKEIQTLKNIVENERIKIQSACDAVAGHWDDTPGE
jgi:hypothetical protein